MDTVIKRVPLILIGVVILLGLLFVGFGLCSAVPTKQSTYLQQTAYRKIRW